MTPHRGTIHQYENLPKFNRRLTCGNGCAGVYRLRQASKKLALRPCAHCNKIMQRKTWCKTRKRAEALTRYRNRIYCNKACQMAARVANPRERTVNHIHKLARKIIDIRCCAKCRTTEGRLAVHHLSGRARFHSDNAIENLQVLCLACHARHHGLLRWRQIRLEKQAASTEQMTGASHAVQ